MSKCQSRKTFSHRKLFLNKILSDLLTETLIFRVFKKVMKMFTYQVNTRELAMGKVKNYESLDGFYYNRKNSKRIIFSVLHLYLYIGNLDC